MAATSLNVSDKPANYGSVDGDAAPAPLSPAFEEKHSQPSSRSDGRSNEVSFDFVPQEQADGGEVVDAMTYHTHTLLAWDIIFMGSQTIWSRGSLWMMIAKILAVSIIVALLSAYFVPNPQAVQVSKFTGISLFLRVFVGILLGFFLSSSMQRWYNCAAGFLELFDAIRNLQMQFIALGVDQEKANLCLRYGVLSAHLLNIGLIGEALHGEEREEVLDRMWKKLDAPTDATLPLSAEAQSGEMEACAKIYPSELEMLRSVDDPAGLIWIWVASLVGRMAQDGDIPPMQTPTYGRIMQLAQNAHGGIRSVRSSVSVQAPFIYVHMLATLVHVNNIINAISFGFTLGTFFGVALAHYDWHPGHNVPARGKDVTRDSQDVVVAFFFCIIGPFIYQALLEVSIVVAQPFASKEGKIPTTRLLDKLRTDLKDGLMMADETPYWSRPTFKPR